MISNLFWKKVNAPIPWCIFDKQERVVVERFSNEKLAYAAMRILNLASLDEKKNRVS
jgi:hypothetical protein